MTNVQEIEKAIEKLPKHDISEIAAWFEKFEAELWDDQIESDSSEGRFDALCVEAVADFNAGLTKEL